MFAHYFMNNLVQTYSPRLQRHLDDIQFDSTWLRSANKTNQPSHYDKFQNDNY